MSRQQFNIRLPEYTIDQIERLSEALGLTKTQLIILAIDRFERDNRDDSGQDESDLPVDWNAPGDNT